MAASFPVLVLMGPFGLQLLAIGQAIPQHRRVEAPAGNQAVYRIVPFLGVGR